MTQMLLGGLAALAAIIGLCYRVSPSAIPRLVMPIIVDAIHGMTRRWAWTHIGEERFKAIAPSVADGNPPRSIILIFRIARVVATLLGSAPRRIFSRFGAPMRAATLQQYVKFKAPATTAMSIAKALADRRNAPATRAFTFPCRLFAAAAAPRRATNHSQSAERAPGQINHVHMSNFIRCCAAGLLLTTPTVAAAQVYTLAPSPFLLIQNNSGTIVNAGCIWTYLAGTTTAATTYTTSSGTPNANPIIADSAGRFTAFIQPGLSLKFVYEATPCSASSHGSVLKTADNIGAVPTSAANVDITGTAGEGVSAGDVVYLSDGSGSLNAGQWYKADADLMYASTAAPSIGVATAAISASASGTFRIQGRVTGLTGLNTGSVYFVSTTAASLTSTAPPNARQVGSADSTTSIVIFPNPIRTVVNPGIACGRLTATTATPVTVADVSAATSIFYTPYGCNQIALYDGTTSGWNLRIFSELTISITACTASKPYDVFIYDNAGTVTGEILVWTNATTRATALVLQDGVWVKTGATTRKYVGSFYCNSSGGQTDDTFAKRNIWNEFNRVPRVLRRLETSASWTYTIATIRQANGATANQLEVMIGVAEARLRVSLLVASRNTNADVLRSVGIGEDSTTTYMTTTASIGTHDTGAAGAQPLVQLMLHTVELDTYPTIGRHVYSWNEDSAATGTTTWLGVTAAGGGTNTSQTGLSGEIIG